MLKYLNWPKGFYKKMYNPWWLLIWKVSTLPLVMLSFAVMYMSLLINQGLYSAEHFRKDLF